MGSNRRNSFEKRCEKCRINKDLCICEYLLPISIDTPVQIIMHYKEEKLTSNTANLLAQIHNKCRIHSRGSRHDHLDFDAILMADSHSPLFLFPTEDAQELTTSMIKELKKPINIIVPDGSWSQAKKFKRRIHELSDIPCIKLPYQNESKYQLRTPPEKGMLSTFEAISKCLGIIHGKDLEQSLDKVFDIFNNKVLESRRGSRAPS